MGIGVFKPVWEQFLHVGRIFDYFGFGRDRFSNALGAWRRQHISMGSARLRSVRPRPRLARLGAAWTRPGPARSAPDRLGSARLGPARPGSARLGSARPGPARPGSARFGSAAGRGKKMTPSRTAAQCIIHCKNCCFLSNTTEFIVKTLVFEEHISS